MSKKTTHQASFELLDPHLGDAFRVLFAVTNYAQGWECSWRPDMDNCVGKTYAVLQSNADRGMRLDTDSMGGRWFPAFCLERVAQAPDVPDYPKEFMGYKVSFETPGCLTIGFEVFGFTDVYQLRRDTLKAASSTVHPVIVSIRGKEIPFDKLYAFAIATTDILKYYKENAQ